MCANSSTKTNKTHSHSNTQIQSHGPFSLLTPNTMHIRLVYKDRHFCLWESFYLPKNFFLWMLTQKNPQSIHKKNSFPRFAFIVKYSAMQCCAGQCSLGGFRIDDMYLIGIFKILKYHVFKLCVFHIYILFHIAPIYSNDIFHILVVHFWS